MGLLRGAHSTQQQQGMLVYMQLCKACGSWPSECLRVTQPLAFKQPLIARLAETECGMQALTQFSRAFAPQAHDNPLPVLTD